MKIYFSKLIFLFILVTNINAEDNKTNQIDKLFGLFGIDKATQERIIYQTVEISKDVLQKSKDYGNQGKNILIEQTLTNGINALVDNTKIKIELFDINNTTNAIAMQVFLKGEDDILDIDINSFDWGVSKDEKSIVFENLDISLNISWIDYIIKNIIKRGEGYIKVPYDMKLFSLLFSIKPDIDSTYKKEKKEPFDIVKYPYDKKFINIKEFIVKENNIKSDISLAGSKDGLKFEILSYDLVRANKRTIIALRDIKFKSCNKPWLQSIIEKQENEIHLTHTDDLYNLLNK